MLFSDKWNLDLHQFLSCSKFLYLPMAWKGDAIAPIRPSPTGDGAVHRNGHVGHFEGKDRRQAARKSYYSLYSWYRGSIERLTLCADPYWRERAREKPTLWINQSNRSIRRACDHFDSHPQALSVLWCSYPVDQSFTNVSKLGINFIRHLRVASSFHFRKARDSRALKKSWKLKNSTC